MRPLELTLRGFRSYADDTTFSWDGRSLVGIVGPIGSGKSSILDAIAFALYGRTPRIAATRSLINQRRDALHVALSFEVGGEGWRVVRSVRRGGASAHAMYRLEGEVETEVADQARRVTDRVEALLGLDFEAFQRSVLLAQNRFAGFLEATGTDRNQVLKGVFGFDQLDRMRALAKERLDGLGRQLAVLEDRRRSADADRRELAERNDALAAAEERLEALEKLREPLADLDGLAAEAGRSLERAKVRLRELEAVAGRIPDRKATEDVLSAAEGAGDSVAATEAALAEAESERKAALQRRNDALAEAGGREGLATAGDLVAAWRAAKEAAATAADGDEAGRRALGELAVTEEDVKGRVEAARRGAEEAAEAQDSASTTLSAARDELAALQQAHRTHSLRLELAVGEPCPVCRQEVAALPSGGEPGPVVAAESGLAAAEAALAEATGGRRRADEAAAEAEVALAVALSARETAEQSLKETREIAREAVERLDAAALAVADRLGAGQPEERLEAVRTQVAAAESGLDKAAAAEEDVRRRLSESRAARESAATALRELRTELAALGGTLGAGIAVGEAPAELRESLAALRTLWIEHREEAELQEKKAGDEGAAAAAARKEMLAGMGLGDTDDPVEVISAARAEVTSIAGVVELLEKRTAELQVLAEGEATVVETAGLLERLHSDLAPSRFLEFVLDERRRALGELGSEHLQLLTAGRYRFDESGDFQLADLSAADAVRSPASLSGGETFLASLALALALAEMVSREGGRLDAFFLDEGFGSLDPEHLDLALDGIERLVTTGPERLVVLVSHVPALMDRVDDVVRLDRDPMTGNTIVLSGGRAE